eukprot:2474004-Lingulodinium_polyedra.AAC.1
MEWQRTIDEGNNEPWDSRFIAVCLRPRPTGGRATLRGRTARPAPARGWRSCRPRAHMSRKAGGG